MKTRKELKKSLNWKTKDWDKYCITFNLSSSFERYNYDTHSYIHEDRNPTTMEVNASLHLADKHGDPAKKVGNQRTTIWNGSFYNDRVLTQKMFSDNLHSGEIFTTLTEFYNLALDRHGNNRFKTDKVAKKYPSVSRILDCPPVKKIIFFNLTEIDKAHRGSDLGLFLKLNTIKTYADRFTLLMNYPSPTQEDSRHPDRDYSCDDSDPGQKAIRKHWHKIGLREFMNTGFFWMHLGKHRLPFN